jgi:hypothetical protein
MNHALNIILLILILVWLAIPNQQENFGFGDFISGAESAAKATSCFIGAGWGCPKPGMPKPPACPTGYYFGCKAANGDQTPAVIFQGSEYPTCPTGATMNCMKPPSCPDDGSKLGCLTSSNDRYPPTLTDMNGALQPSCPKNPKDKLMCIKETGGFGATKAKVTLTNK